MTRQESADMGGTLDRLWDAEQCVWHVDYRGGFSGEAVTPWVCVLEWTQETGNPHEADWVTYTWYFYGDTADEAVADAVAWCKALAPWRRCGECGGAGSWRSIECADCRGTGLADPNYRHGIVSVPDTEEENQ